MFYNKLSEFFNISSVCSFNMRGMEEDQHALELYREFANREAIRLLGESKSPVFVVQGINPMMIAQALPIEEESGALIFLNAKWIKLATEGNFFQRWVCRRILSREIAAHELKHVEQYRRGDLQINEEGVSWKGCRYNKLRLTLGYPFLPWEQEAHKAGWQSEGKNITLAATKHYIGFFVSIATFPVVFGIAFSIGMAIRMSASLSNPFSRKENA